MSEISKSHRFLILRRGEIIPEVFYRREQADAYFEAHRAVVVEYIEEFKTGQVWRWAVWRQTTIYRGR